MGHSLLGPLSRTRKWQEVVGLIAAGAGVGQIANAVMHAAERGLHLAAEHKGLVEAVWLLTQLPAAARERNFAVALRARGVNVPDSPSLADLIAGVSDAVDRRLVKASGRTDLGEHRRRASPAESRGEPAQSVQPPVPIEHLAELAVRGCDSRRDGEAIRSQPQCRGTMPDDARRRRTVPPTRARRKEDRSAPCCTPDTPRPRCRTSRPRCSRTYSTDAIYP